MEIPILIVDDRQENLDLMEAILSPVGYRLSTASSGIDAVSLLESGEFAVVLLDVRMPGMDGIEVASRRRQLPQHSSTPILFITAGDDADVAIGPSLAPAEVMQKGFHPAALQSKVASLVEPYRRETEIGTSD